MSKKKPAGCELREVTSQIEQDVRVNSTAIKSLYLRDEELGAKIGELERRLAELTVEVRARRPLLARLFGVSR